MAIEISGTTYYRFRGVAVIDANGDPLENLTGIEVMYQGTTTPLTVLEFVSQTPVTSIGSGPHGYTGDYWVPGSQVGVIPSVVLDHPTDAFPAQPWDAHPDEYAAQFAAVQAQISDAVSATSAEATTAALDTLVGADGKIKPEYLSTTAVTVGYSTPRHAYWDPDTSQYFYWGQNGEKIPGRPPVQGHVEAHADLYPDAGIPPWMLPSQYIGDVWHPHISRRVPVVGA